MSMNGKVFYKHLEELSTLEMRFRIAAERIEVGWLKQRLERRRKGPPSPPIPRHLALTSQNSVKPKFAKRVAPGKR